MGDRDTAYRGRSSAQRRAIARAADEMSAAFTADDLLAAVRVLEPRVGAATVYRALGAMAETGFVEVVGHRDGAALYARCRSGRHHHHLVCTSCGAVTEADCELGAALRRIEAASGYALTGHDLALQGLCPECRKQDR